MSSGIELFLSDEVQELLDNFARVLNLRVTFFAIDGKPVRRGEGMPNSRFCQLLQNELGEYNKCLALDKDKQRETLLMDKMICYRCHAGLCEGIAPVKIRKKVVGYLMIGQFLVGSAEPDLEKITDDAGLRSKLAAAAKELPRYSEEKFEAIVGMFKTLTDYIGVRELAALKSDRLRMEIDDYIARHAASDIHLPDMAKHLGRSISTISQLLRKAYGTNFKELLLAQRMLLAVQYWKDYPDAPVSEVAYASGFSDQFYFSRVFHSRMGKTPRQYREEQKRRRNLE